MALSNILREPRRELIEQGFGVVALAAIVVVNVSVAIAMCLLFDGTVHVSSREFVAADLTGVVATGILIVILLAIHALGESVCEAMARHDRDPRPTQRAT